MKEYLLKTSIFYSIINSCSRYINNKNEILDYIKLILIKSIDISEGSI